MTDFLIDNVKAVENNQHTLAIFLNLSKAFHSIDHKVLINKLEYFGVRGQSLDWFKNLLPQYVQYKGISSDKQCIIRRVPQGSVLGLRVFVIYTNDLSPSLTYTKAILFADDTTLYASSNQLDGLNPIFNNDLDCLCDWLKANKLSLNIAKTNYMFSYMALPYHANNGFSVCTVTDKIQRKDVVKFWRYILTTN